MAGRDNNRFASYKHNAKTGEELRKKRTEVSVELRKRGRDDQLFKKRNIGTDADALSPERDEGPSAPDDFTVIHDMLVSDIPENWLSGARKIRKMLTCGKNPPIKQVIELGIVPALVRFLSSSYAHVRDPSDSPTSCSLHFEAAWALTNVASGSSDDTRAVVQAGAIPYFVALLQSNDLSVCEQAVWALGNIAGDGPAYRDDVLRNRAVDPILNLVVPGRSVSFIRNIAWTLSNMCRNKNPPPDFNHVRKILPTLASLLYSDDDDTLSDVCWALSYVTDGTNDRIQEVVDQGVVPKLVEFLSKDDSALVSPCLRTLGNIVTGTDDQTQTVIDCGVLTKLGSLLKHPKTTMQKEAAWMISNIAAGTHFQIQGILNLKLVPPLISVVKNGELKAQKEAAWALTNISSGGRVDQIAAIANDGALEALSSLLLSRDSELQLVLLDGISNILTAGKKIGQLESACLQIENCGGLDNIEKLQGSPNDQVYRAAFGIIDKFFSDDEDEENSPPKSGDGVSYRFGSQSNPNVKFNF